MPTILDKATLVDLLARQFQTVESMAADFDEAAWATPTCLPGWTVKDQVSHMTGTEAMLAGDQPPTVEVPEADYLKNDIGKANEVWVEANRRLSGAEVLVGFKDVTARRIEALEAMSQEDFDEPSWTPAGPNETYGRFMRIRHFDCFMHEHDIREALHLADRDPATHVRSCLDEVATGLGFIVGKRAALPSGTSVRIDLTGTATTSYFVVVEERARLVNSLEAVPSVALTMPAMLWLRLTGGRADGVARIGKDIEADGDDELARQLVANLAFTI